MSESTTIRLATREDIPEILAMIHELASFENATSSVIATESLLEKNLSFAPSQNEQDSTTTSASSQGHAKTFLLTVQPENKIAGMALYFHNFSTWRAKPGIFLEDLFVRPQYRRRGYATLLLQELAKEVQRIDGGRLEWSCLKWNENALKFYRKIGAVTMDEWVGLRVDGEALGKLADGQVDGGSG